VYFAIESVLRLLDRSCENILELIQCIIENIRNLNSINLNLFIEATTIIFNKYPNLITIKMLNDLEIGLTNLISEVVISDEDSDKDVNNKLLYRIKAAYLTVALSNYFKLKEKEIPDYVIKWKNLCLGHNEFAEVRKIWENEELICSMNS